MDKEKKTEIIDPEELKANIESTLRDIKGLLNIQIHGKRIEDYLDIKLDKLNSYNLLHHTDVGDLVSLVKLVIENKSKIDVLSNELLTQLRESIAWERLTIQKEEQEKSSEKSDNLMNNISTLIESKTGNIADEDVDEKG